METKSPELHEKTGHYIIWCRIFEFRKIWVGDTNLDTINILMAMRLDEFTRKGSREASRFGNQEDKGILF